MLFRSLLARPAVSAPREDVYGSAKRVRVFREWIETLRTRRGGGPLSVLDFGCGTGAALTVPLAGGSDRIHGVDAHAASIALAQRLHALPQFSFGTETARDLLARGARFDVIVCSEVLEHTTTPADYLCDFRGLLLDGGLLLVSVPNGYGAFETLQRVDRALQRIGIGPLVDWSVWLLRLGYWRLRGRGTPPRPSEPAVASETAGYLDCSSTHVQFFRLPQLLALFAGAGFALEASRGRVVLCGPYVDFWAALSPQLLLRFNAWLADVLPLGWAADWMFRLRREEGA